MVLELGFRTQSTDQFINKPNTPTKGTQMQTSDFSISLFMGISLKMAVKRFCTATNLTVWNSTNASKKLKATSDSH